MVRITIMGLGVTALLAASPAMAEDSFVDEAREQQFEKVVPRQLIDQDEKQFLTLSVDNDMFGGGTDQNYTSGVSLTYFDMGAEPPQLAHWLDEIVPTFAVNDATSVHYSIGQNLYTPEDIETDVQDPDDRPWAAFLYVSTGLTSVTNDHVDELEASVGVVGPAALGEPTQKFIHKMVDSPDPKGWDRQLKNEPGLILSWQRRWPEKWAVSGGNFVFSAMPHAGVTLGNIYTYANTGMTFRFSPRSDQYQDTPPRIRPSMPGTGVFYTEKNKLGWYLFAGVDGRAVARNIFLDGNTFTDSHSVDKNPLVADLNAGVALTYGPARISYSLNYRTKEFDTQDDPSVFGSINLGYRF